MVALVAPKSDARTLGGERCGVVRLGADSAAVTAQGRAGASLARYTGNVEWRVVDIGDRSAVARAAPQVSSVPDVPSPGQQWVREGKLEKILRLLATELRARGQWPLDEGFIDASFTGARKGGLAVGPTRWGKGTKIMAIANDDSLPLAVSIQSASPHESQLVEETLGQSFLDELPERLIGDAAYDSDPLDAYLLKTCDIELIALTKAIASGPPRIVARFAATADAGAWSDSLPGCIRFVGW